MRTLTQVRHWQAVIAPSVTLTVLLSTLLGTAVPASAKKPPNIIFSVMDDVGIDPMEVFGYGGDTPPRAPNIDAIARAGVRFRNAWAMPECSPSRAVVRFYHTRGTAEPWIKEGQQAVMMT